MAEKPETARQATRRRWITLGEIVAVAALALSAASWWDNHQARARDEAVRSADIRKARAVDRLVLIGTPMSDGGGLKLAAARGDQVIQSQTLTAYGGGTSDSTGAATLESDLIADAARAGKVKAGRVPVAIDTAYVVDGETRHDRALYDVGYRLHERVLRSDSVELTGLSLVRRLGGADAAAAVAARYGKRS